MKGYYTGRWDYKGIEIVEAERCTDRSGEVMHWVEKIWYVSNNMYAEIGKSFFFALKDATENVKRRRRNRICQLKRELKKIQGIKVSDLVPREDPPR